MEQILRSLFFKNSLKFVTKIEKKSSTFKATKIAGTVYILMNLGGFLESKVEVMKYDDYL